MQGRGEGPQKYFGHDLDENGREEGREERREGREGSKREGRR